MCRSIKIIIAALIGVSYTIFPQYDNSASYKAFKITSPIILDGKIDEFVWAKTDPIKNFVVNADNTPSPYKTEARILYDNEFIYFAFHCYDENIWSTKFIRDDNLWEEEVIEIFICPNPDVANYIELEINPLGTIFDAYFLDSTKCIPFNSWNVSGFNAVIDIHGNIDGEPGDSLWTCEVAFSLRDIVTAQNIPPKTGDIWYINLYRIENKPKIVFLAWSATQNENFHSPSLFGKLIFKGDLFHQ